MVSRIYCINSGDGRFTQLAVVNGYYFADWNGDGQPDLLSWSMTELTVRLWREGGTYEDIFQMPLWSSYASLQSAEDLDGDGDLDVVLSSDSAHILINAGNGAFQELDLPVMIYSVFDCCDFNGDGRLDIIAWDQQSSLVVFFGDDADPYGQTLRLPVAGEVQMLDDPVDLDRDGYLDQVMAWEPWGPGTRVMVVWGAPDGVPHPHRPGVPDSS